MRLLKTSSKERKRFIDVDVKDYSDRKKFEKHLSSTTVLNESEPRHMEGNDDAQYE